MRLVLVFSGFLAAVAAAGDAPRGTLLSTLGKRTSPLTGAPLAHLGLTPNNLVRSMVSEYRDASLRA